MRKYTVQEKLKIQRHPLWIKYSGAVPDDLRYLVYPDEAKPEPDVKRGRKPKIEDAVESTDGNGN